MSDRQSLVNTIDDLREALQWCSGADDFAPGGKAREGWEKYVKPLLDGSGPKIQVPLRKEIEMAPMAEACQASRMGAVSGAIGRVDSGVGRLRMAIEALEKRLAPIVGLPVVHAKANEELKKSSVPLADKIEGIANLVEAAATRIEALVDRVEL